MTARDRAAEPGVTLDADAGDVAGAVRRLVTVLNQQQAALANLHDAVATIEGRTQRHEAGQDVARALGRQVSQLAERGEQESALRRDLVAAFEREADQDRDQQTALVRRIAQLAEQLEQLQSRLTSDEQRSGHLVAGLSQQSQQESSLDGRLSALEQQVAAAGEEQRVARDALARAEAAREQMQGTLDQLTERTQLAEQARQRLAREIAGLRAAGDREHELRELIEQQRMARTRIEERIAAFAGELHEARTELAEAAEARLALQQQLAGDRQQLTALATALEAQREAIVEHFQRWTATRSEAGRREVEEIERANREARDLLVRLTEGADRSAQDQPL